METLPSSRSLTLVTLVKSHLPCKLAYSQMSRDLSVDIFGAVTVPTTGNNFQWEEMGVASKCVE